MQFPFQLLPQADFDVIGFGTNAVDHLIRVPAYPAFDSKVELTGYTKTPAVKLPQRWSASNGWDLKRRMPEDLVPMPKVSLACKH